MKKRAKTRVALVGLGSVGLAVLRAFQRNKALLFQRTGCDIEICYISARDSNKERGIDLSPYTWVSDPETLCNYDDVDCVVELVGGHEGTAHRIIEKSIQAGKHVVTANKALLARHGQELFLQAEARGVALHFEAAIGGGIPIVQGMRDGLAANQFQRVYGILNGTCNYILTQMETAGKTYEAALKEAQAHGYAEADPTEDVEGLDTAHKLTILATLAFGIPLRFDRVRVMGISSVQIQDINCAVELGYRIRLLGIAEINHNGITLSVEPILLKADTLLSGLQGVTNSIVCEGDLVGDVTMIGPGAGGDATASAVISDILAIARKGNTCVSSLGCQASLLQAIDYCIPDSLASVFYVRFQVVEGDDIISWVADIFGRHNVLLQKLYQSSVSASEMAVCCLTRKTQRIFVDEAIAEMETEKGHQVHDVLVLRAWDND
jgi:homoserine dehydrogenase